MRKPVFMVASMVLLLSVSAYGETGGRLIGSVVDENREPLAGTVINVTGPGAVGIYTAVSDENGRYSVVGLPTHEPLIVKARAAGKVTKVYAGIQVKHGNDSRRDFRMAPPGHHEILVLMDPDQESHQLALEGLQATFEGHVETLEVKGTTLSDQRRVRERILLQPNVVAAFGNNAASIVRREGREIPVVYAMVPELHGDGVLTANACGVSLNGNFSLQLDHLRRMAPEARTLVTVYDPRGNASGIKSLRKEAKRRDLKLVSLPVRNRSNLQTALDKLADRRADAFFLMFDPDLFGAPEMSMIERFVREHDLIYIVPDMSLRIADRALAQAPGFRAMGERAGLLIRQILQDEELPMQIGVVLPEPRDVVVQRSPR